MDDVTKFESMVKQFPDRPVARFSLAKAYTEAGKIAEAVTEYEKAVELRADWMAAWILLGKLRLDLQRVDEAISAFQRAKELAIEQDHDGPLMEMNDMLESLQN
jgi:tetratricopeptide (TPR) repeat protein